MSETEAVALSDHLLSDIKGHLAQPRAESSAFLGAAYEFLRPISANLQSASVVEGLIAIGHFYALSANPVLGLAPATDAVATARLCGNRQLLMKALRLRAWLLGDSGNFPDSVTSVAEALTMAREDGDGTAECACWNTLGGRFQQAGQSTEAISYFERAIELAGSVAERQPYRDVANGNIATAALDVGDLRRAFKAAQMSLADRPEPRDAIEADTRAMREEVFARVLVEVGDVLRAKEHLTKAQKYAAQAGTERSKVNIAPTQALVEIASGQTDIGLSRMKRALGEARSRSKGLLPAILSASVAAYERGGQPEVALTYLHELLDNKKESTEAQILMHHRMNVASIESAGVIDDDARASVLEDQHSQLRVKLKDRDVVKRNLRLLEEHSVAAELHDDTTGEHCYRVGRLASLLGKEIGLEEDVCFLLDHTARLHDIGKLVVPDAILLKPGKLTPGEREIMQRHTTAGAEILGRTDVPQIHIAEAIARHHHERWDGNGYPDRLSGTSIPLAARVTALADVFDALTHKRPYKEAWPIHAALAEIRELSGKQFDPELCEVFLDLVPRLQREVGDLDFYLAADAKNADFIKARRSIAAALKGNDPSVSLFDLRR